MAPPHAGVESNVISNGNQNGHCEILEPSKTLRMQPRSAGPATILAIGTANPKTLYQQSEFPDFYFRVTNSEHETELKAKFTRICTKSGVKTRYLHVTDELIKESPEIGSYSANSLNARQKHGVDIIPRLGAQAAERALEDWGRSRSLITHVVFTSTGGVHLPGADFTMSMMLGLRPDVRRVMIYNQGCFAGGKVIRIAKDLAENNKDARVLVVDSEVSVESFRGPVHDHPSLLVGAALFSDGAGAMIVGSDPVPSVEKPLFEIHASFESWVPNTVHGVQVKLSEAGLHYWLSKDLPDMVANYTPVLFNQALKLVGSPEYNDVFWCVHPGGRAILDAVEKLYELKPEKLEASRRSLRDYGNMFGASVVFILDILRQKANEQKLSTTGDGCKWGLLMGMGPGVTVEVSLLKAVNTNY